MANSGEFPTPIQPKLFARAEIYRILTKVLIEKKPLPPQEWSVVKFDRKVDFAGKEFDTDLFSRHRDALTNAIYYLADFASRMPERVNLSSSNSRVAEMCGELADEIEQITYEPEAVITRHGNLRSWLKAVLAVQTCLIYREETERVIAEEATAKRQRRIKQPSKAKTMEPDSKADKWQSELARSIFQKVSGRQNVSEQPSLF